MNKIAITLVALLTLAIAGVGVSFALQASSYPDVSGSRDLTEYTHEVKTGSFNAIDASISIDVYYTPGSKTSVKIVTTERLLKYVEAGVSSGTLNLTMSKEYANGNNGLRRKGDKVKVYVTAPQVNSFIASTSADIKCSSPITGIKKLKVDASTSGEISLSRLQATDAVVYASTSGEVDIESLESNMFKANASTSGEIDIDNLVADKVSADASTSGDVKVDCVNTAALNASASTSGEVKMEGKAKEIKVDVATAGEFNGSKLISQEAEVNASLGGTAYVNAVRCNASNSLGGSVKNYFND